MYVWLSGAKSSRCPLLGSCPSAAAIAAYMCSQLLTPDASWMFAAVCRPAREPRQRGREALVYKPPPPHLTTLSDRAVHTFGLKPPHGVRGEGKQARVKGVARPVVLYVPVCMSAAGPAGSTQ
jgi:hypothetical protein